MRVNYRLIAGVAMLCCLNFACSKKYKHPDSVQPSTISPYSPPPNVGNAGSQLNKLFKDLRSTPETQCVTAGVLQVIQFKKGTILTFYPNSFKDKAGTIITTGTVCIEMIEMYKPGDMIANRATTMADEGVLESGGQMYIKATKDGQEVYANKYGISFKQSAESSIPMQLFYGNSNNADSAVEWTKADITLPGTTANGTTVNDTMAIFYAFDSCTHFNWINCDRIHDNPGNARTPFYIHLPDTSFKKSNTEVYIILPTINSVVRAWNIYASSPSIYQVANDNDEHHQVPVGMKVNVILISKKNGSYYYYEQSDITVTDGISIHPIPSAKSLDYIKTRLSEL